MAATENTYTQSGSTTNYSFTFPYLKQSDVKVTVAGETVDFGTESDEWQFDNATTIKFNTAPTGGAAIRIYRDTSVDDLTATFYAGSAIKSQDLNDNFNQSLYVTQEAKRDIGAAWTSGDETVDSTETWYTTDDTKIATTKAIQGRLDGKQNLNTNLTNLSNCQTGASGALKLLTQAEIELLDGVDTTNVTTDKINYLSGVTSDIQTQIDGKQPLDSTLTTISGKSFQVSPGTLTTNSDDEIPSSKVVATHVTNSISAIGGFEAIDDEDNFPSTIPVAGVIVSIADATGITVDSSGTSNTARTAGNGSDNVTINNFPASLRGGNGENANPFPLPNNTGLLVISTGSNHTYNFHGLLPTTDDVKQLSDDVNDFFARYRIASSAPASANDDGDLWWDNSDPTATGRKMKVYDGSSSQWIDLVTSGEAFISGTNNGITAAGSSVTGGNDTGLFDGTAYRFRLANTATGLTAGNYLVSLAGTIQRPNAGTSRPSEGFAIIDDDIIFASPVGTADGPAAGTSLFITTFGSALTIGSPSDNTVSTAKIVDDNVTYSKIQNITTANRVLGSSSADGVVSEVQVTNGMIADDTISEGKLDIHNAPSDNKVLKYGTTNGLEWGDPDPEGTAVKSTGETTADKVLKTNGSGGASWQVDGPVVTATASGDIAAGKPVVLNIDGTVSQIIDETKATLGTVVEVTDDTILNYQIVYDPNAEKIIVFWVSYGSGSSGDEAIKYKVGAVNASANTIAFGSEQTVVSSIDFDNSDHFDVVYNTASQRYLLVYSPNNDYGRLIAGTYNSSNDNSQGGIDWGSAVNLSGDTSDSSNDEIFTNNDLSFRLASATGTTDTRSCLVYAVGSSTNFFYNNVYTVGIKTNSSNNNLTISDRESLGPAGADEPSATSAENIINHIFDVAYDPDNEIFIAAVETDGGGVTDELDCWSIVMDSDADITHTQEHNHTPSDDNVQSASFAYDTDLKRFLLFFDEDSGPDAVKARRVQVKDDGDGTYTLSQYNMSQTVTLDTISGALDSNAFYNPDTKELCYPYRYLTNLLNYGRIAVWERNKYGGVTATSTDSGGSHISYSTFRQLGTATNNNIGTANDDFEGIPLCVYHTTAKKIVGIVKNYTSPNELTARVSDAGTPYNFNNKYLGFSTSQCNNGNTATIAVSGNTVTIPTSTVIDNDTLVAAATYYVRGDGILNYSSGTTNEMDWIEAGFGISSTKLLLK